MATEQAQAKLATQVKTGQIRDNNESFSVPMALETIAKTAKTQRDSSNHYVLREEYLTDAKNMMAADFEKQGHPLPEPIRVSLSKANVKRTVADDKKPYGFDNSKTWGALVTVQKNVAGEHEIFVNNEIEDTQALLASLYAALILTIVGPTHHTDEKLRAKFPNGELTFKSEKYDALANKLGVLGKYRGNLVTGKADSLSRILIKIQDALGPCPITPILVDPALKSGLKQEATNFKAVCKNQLCDALKIEDKKPFAIANISAYQAKIMETCGAKMPCPICNPNAKADGSFLVLIDPKAEKEAEKLAKAQKVLEDAKKAAGNVITLTANPATTPAETPVDAKAETPSEQPAPAQAEKPTPKVNRQGKNR